MDNDFVAMGEHVCPVCGIKHTYNTEILIDKRLRKIPENKRVTGYGLCEEHDKLYQDGYIALIVIDESKSTFKNNGDASFENAYRTGDIAHLKRDVFTDMFDTDIKDDQEIVFIDKEVFNLLKQKAEELV